jgi:hypothetical protein
MLGLGMIGIFTILVYFIHQKTKSRCRDLNLLKKKNTREQLVYPHFSRAIVPKVSSWLMDRLFGSSSSSAGVQPTSWDVDNNAPKCLVKFGNVCRPKEYCGSAT